MSGYAWGILWSGIAALGYLLGGWPAVLAIALLCVVVTVLIKPWRL